MASSVNSLRAYADDCLNFDQSSDCVSFEDDFGCGCLVEYLPSSSFCFEIYEPVCGTFLESGRAATFSNICYASMDHSVEYTVPGECSLRVYNDDCEITSDCIAFEDDLGCGCLVDYLSSSAMCTEQYEPVCGYAADESNSTFSNVCYASMDRSVVYTRPGECVTENDETETDEDKLRVYFSSCAETADEWCEFFEDDMGCGCLVDYLASSSIYCPLDYDPVCGWFDEDQIKCSAYPCATTFSNSCGASGDRTVAYTTVGECPSVSDTSTITITEQDTSTMYESADLSSTSSTSKFTELWTVTVWTTFDELSISDWTEESERLFVDSLALGLAVDVSRVSVLAVREGSVVVQAEVSEFETEQAALAVTELMHTDIEIDASLGSVSISISEPYTESESSVHTTSGDFDFLVGAASPTYTWTFQRALMSILVFVSTL